MTAWAGGEDARTGDLETLIWLTLKFATSGGLELEAQWAGRQSEGLATAFAPLYSWVYRRKGSVHRIDVGAACGGLELFCIQCVVSLSPAGRKNVRCCVLSDYACLLAQSLLRTSVAGSGCVLPKHRLVS